MAGWIIILLVVVWCVYLTIENEKHKTINRKLILESEELGKRCTAVLESIAVIKEGYEDLADMIKNKQIEEIESLSELNKDIKSLIKK